MSDEGESVEIEFKIRVKLKLHDGVEAARLQCDESEILLIQSDDPSRNILVDAWSIADHLAQRSAGSAFYEVAEWVIVE